ncbi:unnamed protein product, partial [Ilex paraguariensis]
MEARACSLAWAHSLAWAIHAAAVEVRWATGEVGRGGEAMSEADGLCRHQATGVDSSSGQPCAVGYGL